MYPNRFIGIVCAVLLLAGLPIGPAPTALAHGVPAMADTGTETAWLQFESGGHALGFTPQGVYAATGSHALHIGFEGANTVQPQTSPSANSEGQTALLGRVTYANLWNGVSLTYSGAGAGAIYTSTYNLAPGADVNNIRLRYNSPLTLNQNGVLNIAFQTGALSESAPIAWQEIQGKRVPVHAAFNVSGQEVSFSLGEYDARQALTIDPTLIWSTFLGGSGDDYSSDIAVDGSGNVYVVGSSTATWGSPVRAHGAGYDAFAAKLDPAGNLLWNTFLGGSGDDSGMGIALDGSGNIYITGRSDASWGSPVLAYTSSSDAFVAELAPSTAGLVYNTFLGGSGSDSGNGIVADSGGNVYVTGSSDATWGSPAAFYTGGVDAFVAKLDSLGNLTWSTFLGGSGDDEGTSIAVDGSGNAYIAGDSNASWSGPVRAYASGYDAFVAKLDSSGNLAWNTFLGGGGNDTALTIAVLGGGKVYVSGYSNVNWGSPVRAYTADYDSFVAKLDATGNLTWNTFLGGSGTDIGYGIAVDSSGNVYAAGSSSATWGSPVRAYTAGSDAYAATLDASGNLKGDTFLGGSGADIGHSITVDGTGKVYEIGDGNATWGSPMRPYTAGNDVFVAKVDFGPITLSSLRVDPDPTAAASVHFTVTFDEPVIGVDPTDFVLTSSGVTGASITGVSGSSSSYVVTVATGTGDGSIRLDLVDNDSIVGLDFRPLGGTGAGNGNFSAGESYSINKTLTFNSIGAADGWVLESSETSGLGGSLNKIASTFNLGDNAAKKQYRAVLSFSTGASLPDTAVITGVTLMVKKNNVIGGGNPLSMFRGFMVDIKNGFFGTSALQPGDFQAAASHTYGPFMPSLLSNWYSINLASAGTYINKLTTTGGGLTQIRLRFRLDDNNNAVANILSLYSGNAPLVNRPELIITYFVP